MLQEARHGSRLDHRYVVALQPYLPLTPLTPSPSNDVGQVQYYHSARVSRLGKRWCGEWQAGVGRQGRGSVHHCTGIIQ